jgi:ubiquinone/menaquinone biosynthesis C-methylase UbiE
MNISHENLSGKVVLEVGSGRGDTTRFLVNLLSECPDAQLIVTDISETFFQSLHEEFRTSGVQMKFIRTGAHELLEIQNNSIDLLVCNYTLCAVNAKSGLVSLALRRFYEVLSFGGKIFIEEEFPIEEPGTPMQEVWAKKWRILKSATILSNKSPYIEIAPEILARLCGFAGFKEINWTAHTEMYHDLDILNFFRKRLDDLLPELPNDDLRTGFVELAFNLINKATEVGGMEVPFYKLTAQKLAA